MQIELAKKDYTMYEKVSARDNETTKTNEKDKKIHPKCKHTQCAHAVHGIYFE